MAKVKPAQFDMVEICQALGDPLRFKITQHLAEHGPTACGGFGIDCPPATLTHHFNVLRAAGLIRTEASGTKRINILNEAAIDAQYPGFLAAMLRPAKKRR